MSRIPHPFRRVFRSDDGARTPEIVRLPFWVRVGHHLRARFTLGLVLLVPILFTYFILRIFFDFLDGFLRPIFLRNNLYFPGLGLVALLAIIYVSGLVATNLVGRSFFMAVQQVLLRVPVVRTIYSVGKQLTDAFSGNQAPTGLNRVVATQYLRPGMWTIAFLTGFLRTEDGVLHAVLYVPTAPMPNSGWLSLVPAAEVYDTDLSVNAAMQMVVSGGLVSPSTMRRTPLPEVTEAAGALDKLEVVAPKP